MRENQKTREITLSELISACWKKLYVVLAAVFLALALGGVYGYVKNKDIRYYGGTSKYKIGVVSTHTNAADPDNATEYRNNYVYSEQLLSKLVDELRHSDTFVRDEIMAKMENEPVYDPDAPASELNYFYSRLRYIKSCLSYSYDYQKNPSSISVSVKVLNDFEYAERLFYEIKQAIPRYIEENMERPVNTAVFSQSGEILSSVVYSTECKEITLSYVGFLNPIQLRSQTIKYGLLFGFLGGLAACVVIILLYCSDTRIRHTQEFSESVGVPVLGRIPAQDCLTLVDEKEEK